MLQNVGKQVLNHNDGQIKYGIKEEIEFLLNSRYTELKVIFIAKLMSDENMSGKRDMLSDNLQNIVFSNVKGMIRSDIIPQISNMATGVMGEYAREFIQKRHDLQKLNEKLKQVAAEKSEDGGYQAPKVNRYSDTSQYTETAAKLLKNKGVKKSH